MTDALFVLDPLPDDEVVVLAGAEGRHAATVRRIAVGERILLADGRGRTRRGSVVEVGRNEVRVACEPAVEIARPSRPIVAVQALPKGERAELAIELLTELGVDEIVPWAAARSIVHWHGERGAKGLEKWRRTAQEAGKQSRRPRFPVVRALASTADIAALIEATVADGGCGLVLHEEADRGLAGIELGDTGPVVVIVGPEGGIAPEELQRFAAAGAVAVKLGEPVLRASTAGGAAAAVLSIRLGRWN